MGYAKKEAPQFRFDLSKKKGCSIRSFVIKETTGEDEEQAANFRTAKGGSATVFEELVRLSITYVDDVKAEQPLSEYDGWNSRTRAYVLAAFKSVNGVEDKEVDDFLAGGEPFLGGKKGASDAADSGENG
ncbi:MAG: hypothetical protein ACXVID_04825 [Thermoanaerobaculia bacterium]